MALDNRRYFFTRALHDKYGEPGEIPGLMALDDDDLPPIALVRSVERASISSRETLEATIRIHWFVHEPCISILALCQLGDPRLIKQYRDPANKAVIDQVIVMVDTYLAGQRDAEGVVELRLDVPQAQVPDVYAPYCEQIKRWHELSKGFLAMATFRAQMYEGSYMLFLHAYDICLPSDHSYEWGGNCFQPGEVEPKLDDEHDYIWWESGDPNNIIYVLPHVSSDERIAARYGYTDIFNRKKAEKAAEDGRRSARLREMIADDLEKVSSRTADSMQRMAQLAQGDE